MCTILNGDWGGVYVLEMMRKKLGVMQVYPHNTDRNEDLRPDFEESGTPLPSRRGRRLHSRPMPHSCQKTWPPILFVAQHKPIKQYLFDGNASRHAHQKKLIDD